MTAQSLTQISPDLYEVALAKLNLGLRILGRRDDGYHDLVSIFQTIDLADQLSLSSSARLALSCDDEDLPSVTDNLAWRAADLYLREAGGRPVTIRLTKRIPIGAGLGGGSADAAAVLRGMNRLAARPLPMAQLRQLGARLGSDVPFAIEGGTSLVEGRGERLQALMWDADGLDIYYVLVNPGVAVSTAWAYAQLDQANDALSAADRYRSFIDSARGGRVSARRLMEVLINDFQPVVERVKPSVARASQALAALTPSACSMTGSGSIVFGIYVDRRAASHAAAMLRGQGYPVFLCTPVSSSSASAVGLRPRCSS